MRITLACRRGANGVITTRRIWWRSYLEKDVRANNEDLIVRRHMGSHLMEEIEIIAQTPSRLRQYITCS